MEEITYLLFAIYCHKEHNKKVSIKRVRQLRMQIHNELKFMPANPDNIDKFKDLHIQNYIQKLNRKLLIENEFKPQYLKIDPLYFLFFQAVTPQASHPVLLRDFGAGC